MQWWFYNTKKTTFRKPWDNIISQKSWQWHQWNGANVSLLQLKEDSSPVCEKQTQIFLFIWGWDSVFGFFYVHSLLPALPRPESGKYISWEQFYKDIFSISFFVHIKKNINTTLPISFFQYSFFQSLKTPKKNWDACWNRSTQTDQADYFNLNLVLDSIWPLFSGDIWVFHFSFTEDRQEILLFLFLKCFKIENSFLLIFSADCLDISMRYLCGRIAM